MSSIITEAMPSQDSAPKDSAHKEKQEIIKLPKNWTLTGDIEKLENPNSTEVVCLEKVFDASQVCSARTEYTARHGRKNSKEEPKLLGFLIARTSLVGTDERPITLHILFAEKIIMRGSFSIDTAYPDTHEKLSEKISHAFKRIALYKQTVFDYRVIRKLNGIARYEFDICEAFFVEWLPEHLLHRLIACMESENILKVDEAQFLQNICPKQRLDAEEETLNRKIKQEFDAEKPNCDTIVDCVQELHRIAVKRGEVRNMARFKRDAYAEAIFDDSNAAIEWGSKLEQISPEHAARLYNILIQYFNTEIISVFTATANEKIVSCIKYDPQNSISKQKEQIKFLFKVALNALIHTDSGKNFKEAYQLFIKELTQYLGNPEIFKNLPLNIDLKKFRGEVFPLIVITMIRMADTLFDTSKAETSLQKSDFKTISEANETKVFAEAEVRLAEMKVSFEASKHISKLEKAGTRDPEDAFVRGLKNGRILEEGTEEPEIAFPKSWVLKGDLECLRSELYKTKSIIPQLLRFKEPEDDDSPHHETSSSYTVIFEKPLSDLLLDALDPELSPKVFRVLISQAAIQMLFVTPMSLIKEPGVESENGLFFIATLHNFRSLIEEQVQWLPFYESLKLELQKLLSEPDRKAQAKARTLEAIYLRKPDHINIEIIREAVSEAILVDKDQDPFAVTHSLAFDTAKMPEYLKKNLFELLVKWNIFTEAEARFFEYHAPHLEKPIIDQRFETQIEQEFSKENPNFDTILRCIKILHKSGIRRGEELAAYRMSQGLKDIPRKVLDDSDAILKWGGLLEQISPKHALQAFEEISKEHKMTESLIIFSPYRSTIAGKIADIRLAMISDGTLPEVTRRAERAKVIQNTFMESIFTTDVSFAKECMKNFLKLLNLQCGQKFDDNLFKNVKIIAFQERPHGIDCLLDIVFCMADEIARRAREQTKDLTTPFAEPLQLSLPRVETTRKKSANSQAKGLDESDDEEEEDEEVVPQSSKQHLKPDTVKKRVFA